MMMMMMMMMTPVTDQLNQNAIDGRKPDNQKPFPSGLEIQTHIRF